MNKISCQYAIVRFVPFVETGEFANVGIVLLAAQTQFFGFQLQTRRHKRITDFFGEIDAKVYRGAVRALNAELQRVATLLHNHDLAARPSPHTNAFAQQLFAEIVRPREAVVRFSAPRLALADDPGAKLGDLFSHYVERGFVTKEYKEAVLERSLRMLFSRRHVGKRFERGQVGDEGFHVTFPFVERRGETAVKAIKALNLAQDEPSNIRDHALVWRGRLEKLRRRQALPDRVLFAVSEPDGGRSRREAFAEASEDLQEAGALVTSVRDPDQIVQFAASE